MDPNPTPPKIEGMEIVDVIARGGQSTVYRARRLADGRPVALKVHDSRPLADASRRFDRELSSLERLAGTPGVVQLLGSGSTTDGDRYLVLELADGGTLADHARGGPLDVDEATAIVIGLCRAVDAAHEAEIIHRDLKPANVVRAHDGTWKLADFGVAELMDGDATTTLQVSMGHVAPEILDGAGAGRAADVYSLASILFTLLTGSEPFARRDDESMAATVHRLATTDAPDPRSFGVPAVIARLIEAGLDKDPLRRPVSAWFLGGALEAARRELGLSPVPEPPQVAIPADDATMIVHWAEPGAGSPDAPERRRRRARWLVAAAVVAGMLSFGAFGLAGLLGSDDEEVAAPAGAVDVGLVDDTAPTEDVEVESPAVSAAAANDAPDPQVAAAADEVEDPPQVEGAEVEADAPDSAGDDGNGNGNGNGNDGNGGDGDGNDGNDGNDGTGGDGNGNGNGNDGNDGNDGTGGDGNGDGNGNDGNDGGGPGRRGGGGNGGGPDGNGGGGNGPGDGGGGNGGGRPGRGGPGGP
ncbi:MAG: serine/threonine-protein kinase [Actinomycetota bacterium]